jgi:hypothetical protein
MIRRKYAFIVKLWFEAADEETPDSRGWRGSVENLGTRRRLYFSEIAELVNFLATWTGRPDVN